MTAPDPLHLSDQAAEPRMTNVPDTVPNTAPVIAPETVPEEESFLQNLVYGLSLPERFARSAVGVSAEAVKNLAEFVVPEAFQSSKSYEVAVRNSLGFLISSVGRLQTAEVSAIDASGLQDPHLVEQATDGSAGRFLARKTAGNFIDIAGLATLHVSPLWVLAIVSDVAYGSKTYVLELAQELQSQGLIDDTSTIHRVDDLLDAIQQASGTAASSFDQPPLSLDELRNSAEQTRQALRGIDPATVIPEAEIRNVWTQMQTLASQEHLSLLGVSGAVAMQTVETIKGVSQGTLAGLFVAGNIINRNIFGHYVASLGRIREQGLWTTVRNNYEPYVDLAWNNFTSSHKSWTETVVDAGVGRVQQGWQKVKGWFGKS